VLAEGRLELGKDLVKVTRFRGDGFGAQLPDAVFKTQWHHKSFLTYLANPEYTVSHVVRKCHGEMRYYAVRRNRA
jgi:hypothetical protein